MSRCEVLVIGSGAIGRGIIKDFASANICNAIFSRKLTKALDHLKQEA